MRAQRRAIVLGGAGMLTGVASALVRDGWHVVMPSRRYHPLADVGGADNGRALWVRARWECPDDLARDTAHALGGSADLLVACVHGAYRRGVLHAVEPLLVDCAPVVEVRGGLVGDAPGHGPEPTLSGRPTQEVVLGYVGDAEWPRWPTQGEIADEVLMAVRRALHGAPDTEYHLGDERPVWVSVE